MRRVLIHNLKGGEILAREVWDRNGIQLLANGTVYKTSYSKVLRNLNIDHIYISDNELATNNIPSKVFDPQPLCIQTRNLVKNQLQRFESIGSINIYKFEKLVYTVINEVMNSSHIIESMYSMQDYDKYTYEHSVHVTVIAIMICNKMGFTRYKTYEIAMGCMLHDFGKTKVIEEILNKPGKLTDEEFNEIKKHPIDGYQYVKSNKQLSSTIKKIILTHHEKLDGSGYPLGLTGKDISIGARICTIADIFDAMSSKRPYKEAIPLAETMRIMKLTMREQIDINICTILEEILTSNT